MEAKVYNQKGDEVGKVSLPDEVFGAKWRSDLVHQVVEGMRSNARSSSAKAKGRSQVKGGGRKPWRQKGTGRARHGSTRSPIWVGGGVTHGPLSEKNYKKKISKKMRKSAFFCVLSKKLKEEEILFIESLKTDSGKTKDASGVIKNISKSSGTTPLSDSRNKKGLAVFFGEGEGRKAYQNLPQIQVSLLKNLNPLEILNYKYLLIEKPKESIEFLKNKLD